MGVWPSMRHGPFCVLVCERGRVQVHHERIARLRGVSKSNETPCSKKKRAYEIETGCNIAPSAAS